MMSDSISSAEGRTGRLTAIYARVSSERQRQDETIQSQTVGLRELAEQRGLLVTEDLVFEDEGFSGASLQRPALERLRDRAAEGCFEVLLCHAPDRLARRYAYQVLLLEELARSGVEVCFAKEPERGGTPEDELLRQFQGMIAEYERAQIAERTRRGKAHRARGGSQAVMSGAPYGYRYVKKADHCDAYWEIDEVQAQVVREVFARYVDEGVSIGELARWLTARGVPTKTGKMRWDRSTVWAMLRNPAYRGQAAFGKTKTSERHGGPTRTTRARGERHGRRLTRQDQPAEKWTFIPVPPLITEQTFELAQARLVANAHFSKRNTKELSLLQGVLVCRECGYSYYRTSTRTSNKRISYYRCIGQDGWRHPGGKRCTSRPVRADEIDPLVWSEVRRLLEHPELVQAEINRRLTALRTEHPAARRRDTLQRDLTRADSAVTRLIEAYQEQLISLDELRARTPQLRKRQSTLQAQLDALDAELNNAATYLKLADTLEGFLGRLNDGLEQLDTSEQQRVLRLVVREVLIGGDDDTITIRHSIPSPTGPDDPSYLLRGSSHHSALRSSLLGAVKPTVLDHASLQPLPDHPPRGERAEHGQEVIVGDSVKRPGQISVQNPPSFRAVAFRDMADRLDRVVAATAGPKPVGLRLKPGLPLRLQRIHDPGLMDPIENHGNPERTPLRGAWLGDVHPPDRQGLERLGVLLHPVSQSCFGLRGEHNLVVHACRQTTGVALGHPPHAHQRVGA
jgi:site-specific DNA recombinase